MNMDEYQIAAESTSILNGKPFDVHTILYRTLGLVGEAGEIAEKVKRVLRDGRNPSEMREDIKKELGDVLWYLAMLAQAFDLSLGEVARVNIHKLASRQERGVLHGNGDNR